MKVIELEWGVFQKGVNISQWWFWHNICHASI